MAPENGIGEISNRPDSLHIFENDLEWILRVARINIPALEKCGHRLMIE